MPPIPFQPRALCAASRRVGAIALLCLVGAVSGCGREDKTAPPPAPEATTDTEVVERLPFDAHLSLVNNSGQIDFNGAVADAQTRDDLLAALRGSYGQERLTGGIEVDAVARPSAWGPGLPALLAPFGDAHGAALRFEGDRIVLTGVADADTRARLRDVAARAFPSARLEGLFAVDTAAPPPDLQAAAGDGAKLARSLSLLPIRFDDGAGSLSADSLATVAQAADAIRTAPEGTRLRIVGPVVAERDGGNAVFLSRQRAEGLKVQLILNGVNPGMIETRGWGEGESAADGEPPTAPASGAPLRFELVR